MQGNTNLSLSLPNLLGQLGVIRTQTHNSVFKPSSVPTPAAIDNNPTASLFTTNSPTLGKAKNFFRATAQPLLTRRTLLGKVLLAETPSGLEASTQLKLKPDVQRAAIKSNDPFFDSLSLSQDLFRSTIRPDHLSDKHLIDGGILVLPEPQLLNVKHQDHTEPTEEEIEQLASDTDLLLPYFQTNNGQTLPQDLNAKLIENPELTDTALRLIKSQLKEVKQSLTDNRLSLQAYALVDAIEVLQDILYEQQDQEFLTLNNFDIRSISQLFDNESDAASFIVDNGFIAIDELFLLLESTISNEKLNISFNRTAKKRVRHIERQLKDFTIGHLPLLSAVELLTFYSPSEALNEETKILNKKLIENSGNLSVTINTRAFIEYVVAHIINPYQSLIQRGWTSSQDEDAELTVSATTQTTMDTSAQGGSSGEETAEE